MPGGRGKRGEVIATSDIEVPGGPQTRLVCKGASPLGPPSFTASNMTHARHDTCTMIIGHACTMIIVHAHTTIRVHACTKIIVLACTMITVHACTVIILHACTMIIAHACIEQDEAVLSRDFLVPSRIEQC